MVRKKWYDTIMDDFQGRLPPIKVIQERILSITDDLTRIFCIISYLTGGRISEIVNYKQEKCITKARRNEYGQVIKDSNTGKTIYDKVVRLDNELITFKGLKKGNITRELMVIKNELNKTKEELEVVRIVMRNEKNKTVHHKTIFAPYYFEKDLIDNLFNYLDHLGEDEVVININRNIMYKSFRKYAGQLYYPHFIRALRVGVLLEVYEFNETKIQSLMGWSDLRPIKDYYVFKKDKEILKHYIKKVKEVKSNV